MAKRQNMADETPEEEIVAMVEVDDLDSYESPRSPQSVAALQGQVRIDIRGSVGSSVIITNVGNGRPLESVQSCDVMFREVGAIIARVVFKDDAIKFYQVTEIIHRGN